MKADNSLVCINANWPASTSIRALTTTRFGGNSKGQYAGLNLAQHVGDDASRVDENRALLAQQLDLPSRPLWLRQVHGERLIHSSQWQNELAADGCFTDQKGVVCAVLSADCLPLLLCNKDASHVAALHLGWRGICRSLLGQTLAKMNCGPSEILAWIGPHIQARNYEVSEDVRSACLKTCTKADKAFTARENGLWLVSLSSVVRAILNEQGVTNVYSEDRCVFEDKDAFYSYRREGSTGRMASLIWMET